MEKQLLARLAKAEKRIVDLYKKLLSSGSGGLQTLANILVLGQRTGGKNIIVDDADAIELENTSLLKKGTYNFGGNGGLSRICSNNYEDNWQNGFRHVFDQNGFIRHSTNCFSVIPDANFDVTLRFAVNSLWTLDSGATYICKDNTEGAAIWVPYVLPISTRRDIKILFDTDGEYTFVAGDETKIIIVAVAGTAPQTLRYTIPEGVFSLGDQLMVRLVGTPNVIIKYLISRVSGNTFQYSADESLAILTFFEDGTPGQHYWAINYLSSFNNPTINKDFASDVVAAINDVKIGEMYHTAGVVKIRLT